MKTTLFLFGVSALALTLLLIETWTYQDIDYLSEWYPMIAWGAMVVMGVGTMLVKYASKIPYRLKTPELDLSAVAYLIMGYGFVSMLTSTSISLNILLEGSDIAIAEIPLGKIIPIISKGLLSMAISYGISTLMNFLQNWKVDLSGGEGVSGSGGGRFAGAEAASFRSSELAREIGEAVESMKEFNVLIKGVSTLLKNLQAWFPKGKD